MRSPRSAAKSRARSILPLRRLSQPQQLLRLPQPRHGRAGRAPSSSTRAALIGAASRALPRGQDVKSTEQHRAQALVLEKAEPILLYSGMRTNSAACKTLMLLWPNPWTLYQLLEGQPGTRPGTLAKQCRDFFSF